MSQNHSEPVEFKTEELHVVALKKPHCEIELRVKGSASIVKTAQENAEKKVAKEVVIAGFRKGKAPLHIIRQKFSKSIEHEVRQSIADLIFPKVRQLTQIAPLNQKSSVTFDMKHLSNEGAELVFSFEIAPEVPSVDPSLFQFEPVQAFEVGEKQINEAIRQSQFFFATWKPSENPVKEKDYLTINLDTVEGDAVQRIFDKVRFEVSSERMSQWMQNVVIGAKQGDIVEGISEADPDATEAEKAEFKPKTVRIHILSVEEADLPELNDDFGKMMGAQDFADLKVKIEEKLRSQVEEERLQKLRAQVNQFLLKQYPFDLPSSLVEEETAFRFEKIAKDTSDDERESAEKLVEQEAIDAIRLFYLARKIVNDANIPVTHKEAQDLAIQLSQTQGRAPISPDQISNETFALAISKLILSKAQDHVLASAAKPQESIT